MKISVITAVYNREKTLGGAIASVVSQTNCEKEYVIVDGMSTDKSSEIIDENRSSIDQVIREQDDGIYDAINKGITAATGDVVGFLHADDFFASANVLESISKKFSSGNYDAVYGDLLYVSEDASSVSRYWKSGEFNKKRFRSGWMPPHPTVYIRKSKYLEHGLYRTDLGSAADYECLIRLLYKHELRVGYVPQVMVKMRVGGKSNASISNRLDANRADRNAWIENGISPPWGLRFTKPLSKIPQFFRRHPKE